MEEEKGQGEWPNEEPQSTNAEMHRLTDSTVHRLTVTDNDDELHDGVRREGRRKDSESQTMTMSCMMA
jgi:hypothetical protein